MQSVEADVTGRKEPPLPRAAIAALKAYCEARARGSKLTTLD
jgi:hypothetical protein